MVYSQFGEDDYLKTLFPTNYKGTCVEVGAYDGISGSNTFLFEQMGWDCICIEPIPNQFQKCKNIRKKSVECCISKIDNDYKNFTIFNLSGNNQSAISSLIPDERLIESHKHLIINQQEIKVLSRTLTSVLEQFNFGVDIDGKKFIDFISIDTENTELDVVESLNFEKYIVKYFVVENNYNESFVENYLKKFGYKKFHRTGVNDFFSKN